MQVVFDLGAPLASVGGAPRSIADSILAYKVGVLVEALAQINECWFRVNPRAPDLYDSGVIYNGRDDGEQFREYSRVLEIGDGDCEDLCAARIAELRVRYGEPAMAVISYDDRDADTLYHVTVLRGDGTIEDPSRVLGME